MNQDKLTYLKRAIKRTYKRYTGERLDGNASLKDVTDFFSIPIDEERLDDYIIKSIDYKIPKIELFDKKDNTTYNAEYTADADLVDCYGGNVRYISLTSTNKKRNIESLYYIGQKEPIINNMTIKDENNSDYELVFEKQQPNDISMSSSGGNRLIIRYLQNSKYDGNEIKNQLLAKIFTKYLQEYGYYNSDSFQFTHLYTYDSNYIDKKSDFQNKYTYIRENGIIYGIEELEQKSTGISLKGIGCETIDNLDQYTPSNFYIKNYKKLADEKSTSAIIFRGFTNRKDKCKFMRHLLEIYKNDESIDINYNATKHQYDSNEYKVVNDEQIKLPILNEGKITADELELIGETLSDVFAANSFIEVATEEIDNFERQINIRNGLVEEELDPLSPKLLMDKSFDEISDMISENKEDYFKLIKEQFDSVTNNSANIKIDKPLKKKLGSN